VVTAAQLAQRLYAEACSAGWHGTALDRWVDACRKAGLKRVQASGKLRAVRRDDSERRNDDRWSLGS
jgi:hypothetical protein